MKLAKYTFFIIAILSYPLMAVASEVNDVSANWKCKWCPFEEGLRGNVEIGASYLSEDSFKFGNYSGLNNKGLYFIGNSDVHYQDENANYFNADILDLGLGSRFISLEAGKQGTYTVFLSYDELPRLWYDTSMTPFIGAGHDTLSLPLDWDYASNTSDMTTLSDSLKSVDIKYERKKVNMGISYIPTPNREEYRIKFTRETKQGVKMLGGAFGASGFSAQSSILPEPIDYVTDQLELTAAYSTKKWQTKLGYYGSFFKDKNTSLNWQNPFADASFKPAFGQVGLPPDNEFHQLFFSGAYQVFEHSRATTHISAGRMFQNEAFLGYTVNPSLTTSSLPRNSLNGRVNTWSWKLGIVSNPMPKLRLSASYNHNEQDNKTPQRSYSYIVADTSTSSSPKTNSPYSFRRKTLKINGSYHIFRRTKLSAGFDYDIYNRTFQEVDKTRENSVWAKLKFHPHDMIETTLNYSQANREVSNFNPDNEVSPPENPLMRKFNMADREREQIGVYFSITPIDILSVGLNADYSFDDYSNSLVGLTDSKEASYTLDVSFMPRNDVNIYAFFSRENLKSKQTGSQSYSSADWLVKNNDRINTAGIGIKLAVLENKLDIGLDYAYSRSKGRIDSESDVNSSILPFPDLETKLHSSKLYATYKVNDTLSIKFNYIYEKYQEKDWTIDNVEPDTISSVLALGQQNLPYKAHMLSASLRYQF